MGGQWTVVETLGPSDSWSVLFSDGKPAKWKSLARALPVGVLKVVHEAHDFGAEVQRTLTPARRRREGDNVCALPVPGPDGTTCCVQVWVGDEPAGHTPPRTVVGFTYAADTRLLTFDPRAHDLFEIGRADRRTWTVPEMFRLVERFDNAMELITKSIASDPGDRWLGPVTLRIGDKIRTVQLAMRNGADADDRLLWRGFVHDLVEIVSTPPVSFEVAALQALRTTRIPVFVALFDLVAGRLIRWITDPLPHVLWKGVVDDRDTPHPDDIPRLFAAAADIVNGEARSASISGVRLRRRGGGWTVVDGVATVLPYGEAPSLGIIEMTVTGTSDEPDPVPPPSNG